MLYAAAQGTPLPAGYYVIRRSWQGPQFTPAAD